MVNTPIPYSKQKVIASCAPSPLYIARLTRQEAVNTGIRPLSGFNHYFITTKRISKTLNQRTCKASRSSFPRCAISVSSLVINNVEGNVRPGREPGPTARSADQLHVRKVFGWKRQSARRESLRPPPPSRPSARIKRPARDHQFDSLRLLKFNRACSKYW